MSKQEESKWVKKAQTLMDSRPDLFWYVKYWGGGFFSKEGVPDLLICYKGRFIALEAKSGRNKASPLQLKNIAMIKNCGGVAVVKYDEDIVTFIKRLIERSYDDKKGK